MGVYINMEIPESCAKCLEIGWHYVFECVLDDVEHGERKADCPLIPIPPHGRLIDADAPIAVWEVKLSDGDSCSSRNIETTVSKFLLSHLMGEVPPTIIPAEEG